MKKKHKGLTSQRINQLLQKALKFHTGSDYLQAAQCYRSILDISPQHVDANHLLGMTFFAQRMYHDAEILIQKAFSIAPQHENIRFNYALVQLALHNYDVAQKLFESIPEQALARFDGGYVSLAECYVKQGMYDRAFKRYAELFLIDKSNEEIKSNVFYCAQFVTPEGDMQAWESLLCTLLELDNAPFELLAKPVFHLLLCRYANQDVNIADFEEDRLLLQALTKIKFANAELEKILREGRIQLLSYVLESTEISDFCFQLVVAYAMQGILNEYCWFVEPEEQNVLDVLVSQIEQLQADTFASHFAEVQPLLILCAMYAPWHQLEIYPVFINMQLSWLESVTPLKEMLIDEREALSVLAGGIPDTTAIDDAVSIQVQQQYEENPYPRWHSIGYQKRISYQHALNSMLPNVVLPPFLAQRKLKVLIAGCGTGRQVARLALDYPDCEFWAIDLSLSSLAYAKYKAQQYQLENVHFYQCDILQVHNLKQTFDVIECIGVLHHMAQPQLGLSALMSVLREDGLLHLGLYSALGRRHISSVQSLNKEADVPATVVGIRTFRYWLLQNAQNNSAFQDVLKLTDFYSISGCRDLLFHVQEHLFSWQKIQRLLIDNKLQFLGLHLIDSTFKSSYLACFDDDPDITNMNNLAQYEARFPDTFRKMYNFWCRKS